MVREVAEGKCDECAGKGRVLRHVGYFLSVIEVTDCPTCHGTGRSPKSSEKEPASNE